MWSNRQCNRSLIDAHDTAVAVAVVRPDGLAALADDNESYRKLLSRVARSCDTVAVADEWQIAAAAPFVADHVGVTTVTVRLSLISSTRPLSPTDSANASSACLMC